MLRRVLPVGFAVAIALVCAASGGCGTGDVASFTPPVVERARAGAQLVKRAELENDVRGIVDARQREGGQASRYSADPQRVHVQSADYVTNAFIAAGQTPAREASDENGLSLVNVAAEVRGATLPDEIVLITGHHDSWWLAGADDNASAVGVLIQAAKVLESLPPPKRTIRMVAYDREEEGLFGSERYRRAHASERIRIVLNMDCVGFASKEEGSQSAPPGLSLRDRGDFIAVIANEPAMSDAQKVLGLSTRLPSPVDVLALIAPDDSAFPGIGDFLRSDHAAFWKAGVRGFFITDTANFRNPHYHQKTDLPDTLDYDFYHRVAQLVVGAALAFADED